MTNFNQNNQPKTVAGESCGTNIKDSGSPNAQSKSRVAAGQTTGAGTNASGQFAKNGATGRPGDTSADREQSFGQSKSGNASTGVKDKVA